MRGALLHFEQGVPINDLDVREENKRRMLRVHAVYMQYLRNPMLDKYEMLRQLIRQEEKKYSSLPNEWSALQKDNALLDFVLEHCATSSRREDEMLVRHAAKQAIKIGLETDNAVALTKGGKLLYDVGHLSEPEEDRADMNKLGGLPPVVTTSVKEVDETKEDVGDSEMKRIMAKYGGYVDEKEGNIEKLVEVMVAKSATEQPAKTSFGTIVEVRDDEPLTTIHVEKETDEQNRQQPQQ